MALPPGRDPAARAPLHGLALFAGGAGLELGIARFLAGLGRASTTVCFVEREAYAVAVLVSRMAEGRLDPAPVWDDVATFDGRPWRGVVDFISGGFPCQDISNAGKRAGLSREAGQGGERSGLWREYARIIGEVRPRFVFVENVRPLLVRGIDTVLGDLAALGFDAEWLNLRASDVGAPHGRDRLFLLAHAHGGSLRELAERDQREGRGERAAERGDAVARESGEAMGHAGRAEWRAIRPAGGAGSRRQGANGPEQSSETLADAESGRRGPNGRDDGETGGLAQGRPELGGGSLGMADAVRAGLAESERSGESVRARSTLERGGELADADAGRRVDSEGFRARESVARQGGRRMADAEHAGRGERGALDDHDGRDASGRIAHGRDAGVGEHGPTPWRDVDGRARAWPPGPREAEGWRIYLEQYPDLAPAIEKPARLPKGTQPAVRGGADGVAGGMELRVDSLRLCGNGVVPHQAALAFRLLAARRPDLEAALHFDD